HFQDAEDDVELRNQDFLPNPTAHYQHDHTSLQVKPRGDGARGASIVPTMKRGEELTQLIHWTDDWVQRPRRVAGGMRGRPCALLLVRGNSSPQEAGAAPPALRRRKCKCGHSHARWRWRRTGRPRSGGGVGGAGVAPVPAFIDLCEQVLTG